MIMMTRITYLQTSLTSSPTSLWVGTESSISFKQLANPDCRKKNWCIIHIFRFFLLTSDFEREFNILADTHLFEECRCRGQNPSWCQLTQDQSWHAGQFIGPKSARPIFGPKSPRSIFWAKNSRGPVLGPQRIENQGFALLRLVRLVAQTTPL